MSRRCRSPQVYDLLDPRPRKDKERSGGLQIKEHPVLGIHVQGLQQIVANDAAKVQELMDLGQKNRSVGSTDMNAESSRSHSVCLVTVHQKDTENESKSCYAKLNLVDLAGCDLGVPRCCGAFTPSTRLVSIRRGRGWFLFDFEAIRTAMPRAGLRLPL